jgi:hypothetical protein
LVQAFPKKWWVESDFMAPNLLLSFRVHEMCQSWPAKFGQILPRTDTRLVFCNRKLMRTDIFFTRATKPICNFANSVHYGLKIPVHYNSIFNSCKAVSVFIPPAFDISYALSNIVTQLWCNIVKNGAEWSYYPKP